MYFYIFIMQRGVHVLMHLIIFKPFLYNNEPAVVYVLVNLLAENNMIKTKPSVSLFVAVILPVWLCRVAVCARFHVGRLAT